MSNHLPARNLISLQQMAAIKMIDRRIAENWEQGYGIDVDALLDARLELTEQIKRWSHQP
jgi:hypothetical protein